MFYLIQFKNHRTEGFTEEAVKKYGIDQIDSDPIVHGLCKVKGHCISCAPSWPTTFVSTLDGFYHEVWNDVGERFAFYRKHFHNE